MHKLLNILIITTAVSSVALADVFIKKASSSGTLLSAFINPWMLLGLLLYLLQIVLFTWMFVKGWNLSMVGTMQTVLYAVIILGSSYFVFKESVTPLQIFGILLGFTGIIIANLGSA